MDYAKDAEDDPKKRAMKIRRDISERTKKQNRAKCNEIRKASRANKTKVKQKRC